MGESTATPAAWKTWLSYVSVDESNEDELEELPDVFKQVCRQGMMATQVRHAKDWRTRTFCDLALHLIYEHHIRRVPNRRRTDKIRIFANIQASDLAKHAWLGFFEKEDDANAISVDRFNGTWGNQQAFCQDLIAYLFRSAPYMRRLDRLHPRVLALTQELTLGDWVRRTAVMELDSIRVDPLVSLHTFVETVLPQDPDVRGAVHRLRRLRLQRWANLYERVFTAYGALLREDREDLDWLGLAERFSTIAGGAFVRSQTRTTDSTSGVDGELLGQMVVEMLPSLLTIEPGDIENRRQRADPAN
jgi:hypothetical protein